MSKQHTFMKRAIELAKEASTRGEVPVGAVLVDRASSKVLAEASNRVVEFADPTAHAEMLVLRKVLGKRSETACSDAVSRLRSPEPRPMCEQVGEHGDSLIDVSNEDSYLNHCDICITLEPCAMCAGALAHMRIGRIIFGAYDPKSGGVEHGPKVFNHATTHHKPEIIGGVMESECTELLTEFFKGLRY